MTIEELVESYGVTLAYFDNELWPRPGIYIDDIKIIFVNKSLSEEAMKKVVYHELGHLEHDSNQYQRRHEQFELQANRHMIRLLLKEELNESDRDREFNYVNFMQRHQLTTVADECMVIDEYYNLMDIV
ncbi:ImmA/IrrE family metallo-endopeptidase [Streptococcus gallolyticus]|uniref:ImmA/IrrE family metallo-endopeptidase n=1 Tax=Streptococcus gallolyticus TaxID=315405 RepID=UPI002284CBD6|nr:ImmA/IrrE family metallo-endopeptidase [Streptococcus gallolyticus]MCY7166412.1 ImmA/IrrE family metallo-endopeptidase [Streptococcus gallolyticus subsp. gallolyticus]MCY7183749.1 ImmA/IrrE family metallo-endopeptidase [Streptococcus gallolyticus subsp. gallolyticus]